MNILADTCFWISLCDSSEKDHTETVSIMDKILSDGGHTILVPHPVLYETLCSKMVKNPKHVKLLVQYYSRVEKLPDNNYIENAYRAVEQQANMNAGSASMVDFAIMLMADDSRNNVKAILTKNGRDFASFCQKHGLLMINSLAMLDAI